MPNDQPHVQPDAEPSTTDELRSQPSSSIPTVLASRLSPEDWAKYLSLFIRLIAVILDWLSPNDPPSPEDDAS